MCTLDVKGSCKAAWIISMPSAIEIPWYSTNVWNSWTLFTNSIS